MDELLNKRSGLLGSVRVVQRLPRAGSGRDRGHAGAQVALEVFVHRLARHIGGLAMSLPRLDAVVFTGGSARTRCGSRAMTVHRLRPLGLALDDDANRRMVAGNAGVISKGERPVAAVVNTNEEWMIARDTAVLAGLTRPAVTGPG